MLYNDAVEPVPKPGNSNGCGRKGIRHGNTLGCMAGCTLCLNCVAAAGLHGAFVTV